MTEKIELQKQIVAIRENKCWIHDEKLITTITAPFEGFPTDEIRLMDKMYPFHGLFSHTGCMPLMSEVSRGQRASMCPVCNKEATIYLAQLNEL